MIGDVTLTPVIPPGDPVTIGRTDEDAKLAFAGGWQNTARPRRLALSEWQGWDLATLALPFILDGFANEDSVEPIIGVLKGFIRDLRGRAQPPVLAIAGPVDGTDLRWVVQGIDTTHEVRRSFDGARIRYLGTLNLLEYVDIELLVSVVPTPAAAAVVRATGGAAPALSTSARTYTVRSGDTLSRIAQQQLGNAGRWHEIADLNGVRDPRSLRVGQVLRLP